MSEPRGYLAIVLHAHLPYVRHVRGEAYLEEKWFYEALTETYIPLYTMLARLADEGVPYRLTISLSPTLMSMCRDSLLQARFSEFLDGLCRLAELETSRTRWQHAFHETAKMYLERFQHVRSVYHDGLHGDVIGGYARLADEGRIELITTAATHGYLPLMEVCPSAARAQIIAAASYYRNTFGHGPRGMWLPECGYYPGVDAYLREAGVRYFFTDAHGIENASPRPRYGVYAPIYCPSGVAAFGRDMESSKQVWSAHEGYPGDFDYREFYRDIAYDLDWDYIRQFMGDCPARTHTGIKYYRVTGRTEHKEPYVREWAINKAATHAGNFVFNRERQIEHLARVMDMGPIVVAPYDAELFGHWWFEGPEFLEFVIRKIAYDQNTIKLITPGDYLDERARAQVSVPSMSSWGYMGYNEVWLADCNHWIYPHLHTMARRMSELADVYAMPQPDLLRRALNQAARELMLAQSSDWAFIMKAGTCVNYAVERTKAHISRFNRLYSDIRSSDLDHEWVSDLESVDNIFPDIDYTIYSTSPIASAILDT